MEMRNSYKIILGYPKEKRRCGRLRCRQEDYEPIKIESVRNNVFLGETNSTVSAYGTAAKSSGFIQGG